MLDEWLQTASPVDGMTWAMLLAYVFIFMLIGLAAAALSRMNKARLAYGVIVFVGFILFLKHVIGWDITGILWDMWITFKTAVFGGVTNG